MTNLSVNLNKIALLRNSRGRDYPNLLEFAKKFIDLGVDGLTIHPRQDERHITRQDAMDLSGFVKDYTQIELNIEGYPSDGFLSLVEALQPDQCSLVPDAVSQITSDHGWDLFDDCQFELVTKSCARLNQSGIRTVLFLDPDVKQVKRAPDTGAQRIELYTETYASSFASSRQQQVYTSFHQAALAAQNLNIGVNAGHDLDLENLGEFLTIPNILEVSIGHALTIECIEQGMEKVIRRYLKICY